MDGSVIGYVTYREGHSELGDQIISVELVGQASNLTVRKFGGPPLFSIPWGNLGSASEGIVFKRGVDQFAAFVLRSIPVLDLTSGANQYRDGFYLDYWDEDIERNQRVFFETGSERKSRQVVQNIYRYRDQYHRTLGKISKPSVRKHAISTKRLAAKTSASKTKISKSKSKTKSRAVAQKSSAQKRSKKK